MEKGPGQRPLPRELWRRARHCPLGLEERLGHSGETPGGEVAVGKEVMVQ